MARIRFSAAVDQIPGDRPTPFPVTECGSEGRIAHPVRGVEGCTVADEQGGDLRAERAVQRWSAAEARGDRTRRILSEQLLYMSGVVEQDGGEDVDGCPEIEKRRRGLRVVPMGREMQGRPPGIPLRRVDVRTF